MTVCHLARRAGFGLAVLSLALLGQTRALTQTAPPPTTHTVTLRDARVSRTDDTHLVITAETLGDIKGTISLHLESNQWGWSGTWALVSSYVRDTNPDGTPAAEGEHHPEGEQHEGEPGAEPHHEYIQFVRDGGMNGLVNAGTLAQTPEGAVTSLTSAMTLLGGTLTFTGATGIGDISLVQLEDQPASTGTLTLIF
jgi:hypothetical protein